MTQTTCLAVALLCGLAGLSTAACAARAAEPMRMGPGGMGGPDAMGGPGVMGGPAPSGAATPAAKAYAAANDAMMKGMGVKPTGDADRDFVAMMLPHHRGAVDMARVELRYGRDPVLRKLAAAIVAAQEREIAQMRGWQGEHAGAR